MAGRRKRRFASGPIYGFSLTWLFLSLLLPLYRIWAILLTALLSYAVFSLIAKSSKKKQDKVIEAELNNDTSAKEPKTEKKSYGPEIDPIIEEGNRALSEMGRLYLSIKDTDVRMKINEIMRITDKITQDAIEDPADIPQIKKFMKSINEMLDAAIEAYKKRLDSLFENQALDIETDIKVLNTMLAREGLSGSKDFDLQRKDS